MEGVNIRDNFMFSSIGLGNLNNLNNFKTSPLLEENAELIKSFNETLQVPYPVLRRNPVNPYGLLFWTKEDFFFLKNLVTAFPRVMYTLPILPAAENYADPYCYNTELRKIAVKASFKAQATVSNKSPEPIPYPSCVNSQLLQGSISQCGVPVPAANYLEGTFYPPSMMTPYGHGSYCDTGLLHQHEDNSYCHNYKLVHTHDCVHSNPNFIHHRHITPTRDDCILNSMPSSTDSTPPKSGIEEAVETSLTDSVNDVETEAMELEEEVHPMKSDNFKELYGVHVQSGVDSRCTMAGISHREYSKYMYGESSLHDGLKTGFGELLEKHESQEKQSSLLNVESCDDQSTVSLKPRKIFLHGKFDFPSFSKDDCADSRTTKSRSRARRTGSQGRQSLSPSPENTIRKYLLLSPFKGNVECVFCKGNSQTEDVYRSHPIRDKSGIVVCPYLRKYVCLLCNATGDAAHTIKYCPFNKRGFFAMRENFPPFSNMNSNTNNTIDYPGETEMLTDSTGGSVSVSPVSSTPISGGSTRCQDPVTDRAALQEFQDKFLDIYQPDDAYSIDSQELCPVHTQSQQFIDDVISSSSNSSGKSSSSKSFCTMHPSVSVISNISDPTGNTSNGNGPYFRRLEKVRKSAQNIFNSGRSS